MDALSNTQPGLDFPALNADAVTPSDAADLPNVARALWVGSSGNVRVDTGGGDNVTFVGVQGVLPVRVRRVYTTGTTATNIVALY